MKKIILITLYVCFASVLSLKAQQDSDRFWNEDMQRIAEPDSRLGWIYFSPNTIHLGDFFQKNKAAFRLGSDDKMSLLKIEEDQYGYHHHRFQQMYKGLKIEGAEYMVHEKDKYVVKANGKLIPDLNINTRATISKDKAFRLALEHVDAKTYLWQNQKEEELIKRIRNDINATYFPEGELVITPAKGTLSNNIDDFRLAYRFDIYTDDPPDANAVYIDAQQGTVLKTQTLVMSCVSGTGCTLYNSPPNQSINTQFDNGQYNLYDDCRGGGIHTVLNGNDVYKTTNNWTATSDCPVVSTHWGSEVTYDYFSNIHNRNSFDDNGGLMYATVLSNGCDNAQWYQHSYTRFFNGCNAANDYLVSLDVVGHEWAHAVTDYSANLSYTGESGTLNESFSDIFGTMVEFYGQDLYDPTNPGDYLIGEDMWIADGKLRDMKDPKTKNKPDTYQGSYWSTSTHTGSSVQNHWFYLLAEGSSATDEINDNGDSFSFSGIGRDKAADIAYRNLTTYLVNSSQYADARQGSIEAARDLFGDCSIEVLTVVDAWNAVGVYGPILNSTVGVCGDITNTTVFCDPWDPDYPACLVQPNIVVAQNDIIAPSTSCTPSTATTVFNTVTAVFKAGESICLNPGFEAVSGSNFTAYIVSCTGGSFKTKDKQYSKPIATNIAKQSTTEGISKSLTSIRNIPNPFSDQTNFQFELPEASKVQLEIYDVSGKTIAVLLNEEMMEQGQHQLQFNATDLPNGMYIYKLSTEKENITQKMFLKR